MKLFFSYANNQAESKTKIQYSPNNSRQYMQIAKNLTFQRAGVACARLGFAVIGIQEGGGVAQLSQWRKSGSVALLPHWIWQWSKGRAGGLSPELHRKLLRLRGCFTWAVLPIGRSILNNCVGRGLLQIYNIISFVLLIKITISKKYYKSYISVIICHTWLLSIL